MKVTLTKQHKGFIYIAVGLILLLHTLGVIEKGLNYIIIFGSFALIVCGFIKIDGMACIQKYFPGKNKVKD
jgi:hypothetical protein